MSAILSLDATPTDAPMAALGLDAPAGGPAGALTFVTPGGRYTLPHEAVNFSPVLSQLLDVHPDLAEYNLVELLGVGPAREEKDADGEVTKHAAHSLYGIPESYYKLVFDFFNLLHSDKGIVPGMPGTEKLNDLSDDGKKLVESELRTGLQDGKINPFPEHCTVFDPTAPKVLPQAYWALVKDWAAAPSLKDIGAFDFVALNFGNYALSKLNELAGAFWTAKNEDKLEAERHHVEHIIQRDVAIKVKTREREEAKKKAAKGGAGAAAASS
jgi:hypothetical protein